MGDVLALLFGAVLVAVNCLVVVPKLWSDRQFAGRSFDRMRPLWNWSDDALWRFLATMPTVSVGFALGMVVAVMSYLVKRGTVERSDSLLAVARMVTGCSALCLLLGLSILFFERPKFLMPAHMRSEVRGKAK